MKLSPWRHSAHKEDSTTAIKDAISRADQSAELRKQGAEMAQQFRTQRQTNGFVEIFQTILADTPRRTQ